MDYDSSYAAFVIARFIIGIIIAIICAKNAARLNRNKFGWGVFGYFMPLLAIIWLQFLKPKEKYSVVQSQSQSTSGFTEKHDELGRGSYLADISKKVISGQTSSQLSGSKGDPQFNHNDNLELIKNQQKALYDLKIKNLLSEAEYDEKLIILVEKQEEALKRHAEAKKLEQEKQIDAYILVNKRLVTLSTYFELEYFLMKNLNLKRTN